MKKNISLLIIVFTLTMTIMAQGVDMFKLHALFGDDMVLQRDKNCAIFGFSDPKSEVEIVMTGQSVKAISDDEGRFTAYLKPLKAGGPYELKAICEDKTITLNNVYVGEVWLSSGQSNMEWAIGGTLNAEYEAAHADNPMIRIIDVPTVTTAVPLKDVNARWEVVTPQNARKFSAVSYFFARDLQAKLNVPIGIISSSQGGSWSESWTRWEAMDQGDTYVQPIIDRWYAIERDYKNMLAKWEDTGTGDKPVNPDNLNQRPAAMWNGMIAPLIPATFRGVIWWQGEYNSERCQQYERLFTVLIDDWRAQWNDKDMPFIYVQLQNFDIQNPLVALGSDARYFELRDAQLKIFKAKRKNNVGMALAVDVGHPFDIHPPNKQALGSRMALIARNMVYGENKLQCYGPTYKSYKIKGSEVTISFDDVGKGLFLRSVGSKQGFQIAGEDQVFHDANAKIVGKDIVVSSDRVKSPIAVRYAFEDNPVCTLYNIDGLPASPFRTDDWKLFTDGKF